MPANHLHGGTHAQWQWLPKSTAPVQSSALKHNMPEKSRPNYVVALPSSFIYSENPLNAHHAIKTTSAKLLHSGWCTKISWKLQPVGSVIHRRAACLTHADSDAQFCVLQQLKRYGFTYKHFKSHAKHNSVRFESICFRVMKCNQVASCS